MDKVLTKEQKSAVMHKTGPLLVIAGAGTGKTTVLVERIRYLISQKLALPSEILALTFTEKAAAEMQARVDEIMPLGYSDIWISTFHSFCDRVLRENGVHIGIDPSYKILTRTEAIKLVSDNIFSFNLEYFAPLSNPTKFVYSILVHFSRLSDEAISEEEYISFAKKKSKSAKSEEEKLDAQMTSELANSYKFYKELKLKNNFLDYSDLIFYTLLLFKKRPNILRNYQEQFKYILIDEFQDTNYAQNELAILLSQKSKNITVVGDDDQAIYRFRGASISNILQFKKVYRDAKVKVLTENFRSYQNILDCAYDFIQHNNPDRLEMVEKINKKLISQHKNKEGRVWFVVKKTGDEEAEFVAKKIQELVSSKTYDYQDFAILVRANNHADPFIKNLERNAIPYLFLGPEKFFLEKDVADLTSYLRILVNVWDSASFYRFLSSEIVNIKPSDLALITAKAKKYKDAIYDICKNIEELEVSKQSKEEIIKINEMISNHLELVKKRESAGRILYLMLEKTGYLAKLVSEASFESEKKSKNAAKLFEKIKAYESQNENADIFSLIDFIDLSKDSTESVSLEAEWGSENAVKILTVHSSKGLEFPVVFIVNLVHLRFPSTDRSDGLPVPKELIKEVLPKGDFHLQEERRLFYVALTRAKKEVYMTAAYFYGDSKRPKKISPFVAEALGTAEGLKDDTAEEKKENFIPEENGVIKIDKKEKKTIKIDYLSYSQIEAFRTCPMHYRLQYILKLPTESSASQSLGVSIHDALYELYDNLKQKKETKKSELKKLLSKNWHREGFLSKEHEEKMKEKGLLYLKTYFENEFKKDQKPIFLEYPFLVDIFKKGERKLAIGGKIDRVDATSDGIEIIDYKTGANVPTQKEVDHNLQLTFYTLASVYAKDKTLLHLPEEIKLTLYYFDGNKKLTTTRTKEDLKKAIDEIFEIRRQIENSDFSCSGGYLCQNCEFRQFCKKA